MSFCSLALSAIFSVLNSGVGSVNRTLGVVLGLGAGFSLSFSLLSNPVSRLVVGFWAEAEAGVGVGVESTDLITRLRLGAGCGVDLDWILGDVEDGGEEEEGSGP